jgi:hypothetical protein
MGTRTCKIHELEPHDPLTSIGVSQKFTNLDPHQAAALSARAKKTTARIAAAKAKAEARDRHQAGKEARRLAKAKEKQRNRTEAEAEAQQRKKDRDGKIAILKRSRMCGRLERSAKDRTNKNGRIEKMRTGARCIWRVSHGVLTIVLAQGLEYLQRTQLDVTHRMVEGGRLKRLAQITSKNSTTLAGGLEEGGTEAIPGALKQAVQGKRCSLSLVLL